MQKNTSNKVEWILVIYLLRWIKWIYLKSYRFLLSMGVMCPVSSVVGEDAPQGPTYPRALHGSIKSPLHLGNGSMLSLLTGNPQDGRQGQDQNSSVCCSSESWPWRGGFAVVEKEREGRVTGRFRWESRWVVREAWVRVVAAGSGRRDACSGRIGDCWGGDKGQREGQGETRLLAWVTGWLVIHREGWRWKSAVWEGLVDEVTASCWHDSQSLNLTRASWGSCSSFARKKPKNQKTTPLPKNPTLFFVNVTFPDIYLAPSCFQGISLYVAMALAHMVHRALLLTRGWRVDCTSPTFLRML